MDSSRMQNSHYSQNPNRACLAGIVGRPITLKLPRLAVYHRRLMHPLLIYYPMRRHVKSAHPSFDRLGRTKREPVGEVQNLVVAAR